jgi:hypothetical protein
MNKLQFTTLKNAVKQSGVSYIGSVSSSAKIIKNEKFNELTYIIYLAPSDLSGYNVCPMASKECRNACLHESGHNKIDKSNRINKARIKKTELFFQQREFFMDWVYAEIKRYKKQAEKRGMKFSIRLNGTSDIEPTLFKVKGKTLFELLPNVQFYDYTKVPKRMALMLEYPNYDVTFSYSGHNWQMTKDLLENGLGRVSMVFDKNIPETYEGYKVIDGDTSDLRHYDEWGVIVGLKFKKVREKIDTYNSAFIIPLTYMDMVKKNNERMYEMQKDIVTNLINSIVPKFDFAFNFVINNSNKIIIEFLNKKFDRFFQSKVYQNEVNKLEYVIK